MNMHRQAERSLAAPRAAEHLCLDHHVERRGGLVRDQDARVARERKRDQDTLALAAGELVRVVVDAAQGIPTTSRSSARTRVSALGAARAVDAW